MNIKESLFFSLAIIIYFSISLNIYQALLNGDYKTFFIKISFPIFLIFFLLFITTLIKRLKYEFSDESNNNYSPSIIIDMIFLFFLVNELNNAINTNNIPMIFLNGLFSSVMLVMLIFDYRKNHNETILYNQKKYKYFFKNTNKNWLALKEQILSFYKKYGFDNIAIDTKNTWMLKNSKNQQTYILISKKDDLCLEIYNTIEPNIEIMKNINKEVNYE